MIKLIIFSLFIFCSFFSYSQNVGIGTNTPHASAALDIQDSSKGILIPRMTMAQRTAIQNPAEGLMVYQTDSARGFWYWDGGKWQLNLNKTAFDTAIINLKKEGVRIGISTNVNWQCPPNINLITVELWGGSGGGGGGSGIINCSLGANGGNGGKGGYSRSVISVIPGNSYQIIIGQGGIGGTPGYSTSSTSIASGTYHYGVGGNVGGAGGNTSFSNLLIAYGGNGGVGGFISECVKYSINGQDGLSSDFPYPQNYVIGNRSYIPTNFLTQYPSLSSGGAGGTGAQMVNNFGNSGGNGQEGYCIISY
jgi:hypothetical protein